MNCFHFSVSLGYKTTPPTISPEANELWIAFIFQYLWDTKQHIQFLASLAICCELLSFFSIFGIQNNEGKLLEPAELVVNCFHFSVSLGYKTTEFQNKYVKELLWIAFIFQYLWDTKQPENERIAKENSCELLSFFSIFGIQNNRGRVRVQENTVVNCFHFSVSLGYKTTH